MTNGAGHNVYMIGSEFTTPRRDGYNGMSNESSFNSENHTKGKGQKSEVNTSAVSETENHLQGYMFTKNQYSLILRMLNQNEDCTNISESASHRVQANSTGKSLLVSEHSETWIIETGATNHMTYNIEMLDKESVVQKSKICKFA